MRSPIAIELARAVEAAGAGHALASASQNHDRVAPGALARMTALPGEGGITAAWEMKVATADGLGSALARLDGRGCAGADPQTALDGDAALFASRT